MTQTPRKVFGACIRPLALSPCFPHKALITPGHELAAGKNRCRGAPGSVGLPGRTWSESSSQAQAADGQEKKRGRLQKCRDQKIIREIHKESLCQEHMKPVGKKGSNKMHTGNSK